MKRLALILAVLASPAIADPDQPHRDWGQELKLDMTVDAATACISRGLSRKGKVVPIPADGGIDIDFHPNAGFVTATDAWATFRIRRADKGVSLRALYRRPYTARKVTKSIDRLDCLRRP